MNALHTQSRGNCVLCINKVTFSLFFTQFGMTRMETISISSDEGDNAEIRDNNSISVTAGGMSLDLAAPIWQKWISWCNLNKYDTQVNEEKLWNYIKLNVCDFNPDLTYFSPKLSKKRKSDRSLSRIGLEDIENEFKALNSMQK